MQYGLMGIKRILLPVRKKNTAKRDTKNTSVQIFRDFIKRFLHNIKGYLYE